MENGITAASNLDFRLFVCVCMMNMFKCVWMHLHVLYIVFKSLCADGACLCIHVNSHVHVLLCVCFCSCIYVCVCDGEHVSLCVCLCK